MLNKTPGDSFVRATVSSCCRCATASILVSTVFSANQPKLNAAAWCRMRAMAPVATTRNALKASASVHALDHLAAPLAQRHVAWLHLQLFLPACAPLTTSVAIPSLTTNAFRKHGIGAI